MVATWPAELPQHFDRPDFEAGMGDGRLQFNTEAGPGKDRQGFAAVVDPVRGRMTMRGAQRQVLFDFVRKTLAGGSLPFLFPDPHGGFDLFVKFGESLPRWVSLAGDFWRVQLDLVSLPTGTWITGAPELPPGVAYVTYDGAYVIFNGALVTVAVP